ncbi:MAG: penicillin-binding transpeptidase domain-containing protein, partial [Lentisphaeria bacterium]
AKLAQNSSIELAGKTGTASLGTNRNTWFVCYGPVEKPKYACVVFVRNGDYGGTSAAPVAADFFKSWLGEKKIQ